MSDHGDGACMDGADLVGIVTPSDIARWMQMSALRSGSGFAVPRGSRT